MSYKAVGVWKRRYAILYVPALWEYAFFAEAASRLETHGADIFAYMEK